MKKSFLKFFYYALVLVTVISAFTVATMAAEVSETKGRCTVVYTDETKTTVKSVTGGVLYVIDSSSTNGAASVPGGLWAWNYYDFGETGSTVYTAKQFSPENLQKLYGPTRTEYGLSYDLSEDGTLRIYAPDSASEALAKSKNIGWVKFGFPNGLMHYLQNNDATYEGGYFRRNQVNKIVIETEISGISEKGLNAFSNCTELIIPSTLVRLETEAVSRMHQLKSIKVAGADYTGYNSEYVVDLRNITEYRGISESFIGSGVIAPIQVLLSSKICTLAAGNNNGWGNASTKTTYEEALAAKNGIGTFSVYTPTGESCEWIDDVARRSTVYTQGRVPYYTVNVYKIGDTTSVSQLGFQVRTSDYNGLRSAFKFGAPQGRTVVENGTLLAEPKAVGANIDDIIEYGVIVAKKEVALAKGMTLTKSGDTYVTNDSKIIKVEALPEKVDQSGLFYVTVKNFSDVSQMTSKIRFVGYEIHRDGNGNENIVYATALPDTSICDVTVGSYEKGLINKSVEEDGVFESVLSMCKYVPTLNQTAIDKLPTAQPYQYTVDENGDLVDSNRVHVSIYQNSNGKYVGIIHTSSDTITPSFVGGRYSAGGAINPDTGKADWTVANHLDSSYIGVTLDTIVIDSDVVSSGTSNKVAFMSCKNFMTTLIYPDGFAFHNQVFNACSKLATVIPFSKCTPETDWAGLVGTLDLSKASLNISDWVFAQVSPAVNIILPLSNVSRTMGAGFFGELSKLVSVYPDGATPPAGASTTNRIIDLRGTGYKLAFTQSGELYQTNTEIFKNIWKGISVIQTENGEMYKYTSEATSNTAAKPWSFTREVYSGS